MNNENYFKVSARYGTVRKLEYVVAGNASVYDLYSLLLSKGKPVHLHLHRLPATQDEIKHAERRGLLLEAKQDCSPHSTSSGSTNNEALTSTVQDLIPHLLLVRNKPR